MGVHDGHRKRMKGRYLEHGLDNFTEIEALELLLYFAIPRRDTNIVARRLLERFGSLLGVFEAGAQELSSVDGVGETAAALITLVPRIMKQGYVERAKQLLQITNSTEAARYLIPRFMMERDEVLLMICLDPQKRVLSCTEVNRGVVNAVQVNTRRIVELAIKNRASSVLIAHNHPCGLALPSREDDATTEQIFSALKLVAIPLVDHIIVSGTDFVSYADSGVISMYERR